MKKTAFIILALPALMLSACAAPEEDTEDLAPGVMSGVYGPRTDRQGAEIQFLEFGDESRYVLVPKGCSAGACLEVGTFAVDREHGVLELTPDGRAPYTLPCRVGHAGEGGMLRPKGLTEGEGSGPIVENESPLVAQNVLLAGREYELVQSKKTRFSYAGSEWQNNLTLNETELRRTSRKKALDNCAAAQTDVPANGTNHCQPGDYIWGNRLVKTVAATACERGTLTTTCTTIITIETTYVGE